ncbi:efflux RND transporter permease subunit [Thermaerobacter subterraneus]|uniref:Cation/multidrug efflux pump n=1 Tax=Thermaerobacter subterraneus DSM 13965 TaxID=867903 RepID=K6PNS7_9FIRM|nr:efflux RND transporter permease subunit [Thermaerobacter subterraneus]EKP94527.1 cation/multidrug efflux pump [Thermaerobacter subterraneus DSM 13965]
MPVWRWAIARPVATLMAMGVLVWAGFFALRTLPVGLLPALNPPVLTVVASLPGASPEAIDQLLGQPLSQALRTVSGVDEITSRSGDETAVVVLRFHWGTDLEAAREQVHQRLDAVPLPPGTGRPQILRFDPQQLPVMEISLAGPGDAVERARRAEEVLLPRLEAVPGVAAVTLRGAPAERVEVVLDAAALRRHGLVPGQVQVAVAAAAATVPAGAVAGSDGSRRWPVEVEGGFHRLEELERVVVGLSSPVAVPAPAAPAAPGGVPGVPGVPGNDPGLPLPPGRTLGDLLRDPGALLRKLGGGPLPGLSPSRSRDGMAGGTDLAQAPGGAAPGGRTGRAPGSDGAAPGRVPGWGAAAVGGGDPAAVAGGVLGRAAGQGAPVLAGAVPVRLGDVARIHIRRDPPGSLERLNGRDGLGLMIYQEPAANTVSVSRAVRAALAAALASLPGWQATVTYDGGLLVERAVRGVGQSLLAGSLLAVAILWLFLRRGRAVLVIAAAIPVSACATLAAMHLAGMTLNVMSLGGLALSAGVLVDQAIVVLESIARRRQEGLPAAEAAAAGTEEVAAAIAGSTVTNLIVFLPVLFLGGLPGQLFHDLAVTNALAQAASLLVAVTMVPALAAWWLEEPATAPAGAPSPQVPAPAAAGPRSPAGGWPAAAPFGRPAAPASAADTGGAGAAGRLPRPVEACLAHPGLTLLAALVMVAASIPAAARLGTEFLPAVDEGAVDIAVTLPEGASLAATAGAIRQVESALAGLPGIQAVISRAGGGPWPGQAGGPNQGLVRVHLAAGAGSSQAWAERIRRLLARAGEGRGGLGGAEVTVRPRNLWAEVGAGAPVVELAVRAPDAATLARAAERARRALAATPGLADVAVDLDRSEPRLAVRVDAAAAAGFGLAPVQVGQQLRLALAGETVARARVEGRWLPVVLRLGEAPTGTATPVLAGGAGGAGAAAAAGGGEGAAQPPDGGGLEDAGAPQGAGSGGLAGLPVAGGTGWARLADLAVVRPGHTPAALVRRDGWLAATLTARVQGVDLGTAVARARERVAAVLPPGAAVEPAGTAVLMAEGFGTLVPAALGALLLIYMAMAAQFESLVHPLLMMVTLPLALTGAVAGLAATGHAIGLTAVMGAVVLAGIAVNNGIVLVDAARRYRAAGADAATAIRLAWSRRLRPVLMTALTTLLGSLPMILVPGQGSELEVPLAAVLVGGLFTSTVLTLVVLPCAWLLAEGRRRPGAAGRA